MAARGGDTRPPRRRLRRADTRPTTARSSSNPVEGSIKNRHKVVEDRYGLESVFLDLPPVEWVPYQPKAKMLALDEIYPEGFEIPKMFFGKNVVHLPTMKTHVFTTITGAMKNAFGGLLNRKRHWTPLRGSTRRWSNLLRIQKEIHPGIFAVTDGTFAGDGPGPRAMRWHEKNVIIAGPTRSPSTRCRPR